VIPWDAAMIRRTERGDTELLQVLKLRTSSRRLSGSEWPSIYCHRINLIKLA
jgi:hypothetical protein